VEERVGEAFKEGQVPPRAVEPLMKMMMTVMGYEKI
jgi:hypothetical protein